MTSPTPPCSVVPGRLLCSVIFPEKNPTPPGRASPLPVITPAAQLAWIGKELVNKSEGDDLTIESPHQAHGTILSMVPLSHSIWELTNARKDGWQWPGAQVDHHTKSEQITSLGSLPQLAQENSPTEQRGEKAEAISIGAVEVSHVDKILTM